MINDGKITGKVKVNTWLVEVKENLTKLTIVLEDWKEEYPQGVSIDFYNERAKNANSLKPGDDVDVYVNFKCREYNGKYYTSINGWKYDLLSTNKDEEVSIDDDLPF